MRKNIKPRPMDYSRRVIYGPGLTPFLLDLATGREIIAGCLSYGS